MSYLVQLPLILVKVIESVFYICFVLIFLNIKVAVFSSSNDFEQSYLQTLCFFELLILYILLS